MENRDDADAGAQVLGVGGDRERGLGRSLYEQVVDHGLVDKQCCELGGSV